MNAWVGFLGGAYPYVAALHVAFVMFWMAALFMIPRFYAYHTEDNARHGIGSAVDMVWRDRERKILRIVATPAMLLAWILGLLLVFNVGLADNGWLHLKLGLVLLLTAAHGIMASWRKKFARGENLRTGTFYRLVNETPALLMIPILILVIAKPWY
jgi:protoporphyrinogen IX oxidase